jgi:putative SOS response-associated peptidase YedK
MCGRFTHFASNDEIARLLQLAQVPYLAPRYNVAPTQQVFAARVDQAGHREPVLLKWGLIPSWADDPAIGNRMINARSETAADKPSFRSAFRKRRCLIPASGFYEWQAVAGKKQKQPFFIRMEHGQPFAFAGLWEVWNKGEEPVESCTILTPAANDVMKPLHDRMPVILDAKDFDCWLDPTVQDRERLEPLLVPYHEGLTAFQISTFVNSPRNQGPKGIEPVTPG